MTMHKCPSCGASHEMTKEEEMLRSLPTETLHDLIKDAYYGE